MDAYSKTAFEFEPVLHTCLQTYKTEPIISSSMISTELDIKTGEWTTVRFVFVIVVKNIRKTEIFEENTH